LTEKDSNQDILAVCQGSLHDFQHGFDKFGRLGLGMAKIVMDGVNDVGFGKSHGGGLFGFLGEVSFQGGKLIWSHLQDWFAKSTP